MQEKITHTEGVSNTSAARRVWAEGHPDTATRALPDREAAAFLPQSLSSPCVSSIAKAKGIWIEDAAGRRFMDFHGNSVRHIGYAHPRLVAAVTARVDSTTIAIIRDEGLIVRAAELGAMR